MPNYVYDCEKCGVFTEHRPYGKHKDCPKCGQENAFDYMRTVEGQADAGRGTPYQAGWNLHAPGGPLFSTSAADFDRQLAERPGNWHATNVGKQDFSNHSQSEKPEARKELDRVQDL